MPTSRARARTHRGNRTHRLVALDHPAEQAELGAVFDLADGERADARAVVVRRSAWLRRPPSTPRRPPAARRSRRRRPADPAPDAVVGASGPARPPGRRRTRPRVAAAIRLFAHRCSPRPNATFTPNRLPISSAAWRHALRSVMPASVTCAPSSAAITADANPTTPVAPNTETFSPSKRRPCFSRSIFSARATIAAAVVNEPAGSANSEITNGLHHRLLRRVEHVERERSRPCRR